MFYLMPLGHVDSASGDLAGIVVLLFPLGFVLLTGVNAIVDRKLIPDPAQRHVIFVSRGDRDQLVALSGDRRTAIPS